MTVRPAGTPSDPFHVTGTLNLNPNTPIVASNPSSDWALRIIAVVAVITFIIGLIVWWPSLTRNTVVETSAATVTTRTEPTKITITAPPNAAPKIKVENNTFHFHGIKRPRCRTASANYPVWNGYYFTHQHIPEMRVCDYPE